MTKKKILALLKKHDVEVPAELETELGTMFRGTKTFSEEDYQTHIKGLEQDWIDNQAKRNERETLINSKLKAAKIKESRYSAFKKLFIADQEGADLDKVIAEGIKEMPEFKDIGTPPEHLPKEHKEGGSGIIKAGIQKEGGDNGPLEIIKAG